MGRDSKNHTPTLDIEPKIDARCYFTSKCKISPRVIYFIQIHSEQAESPDHAVSIFSMI